MKERPILFSEPMVRALLEGRKTQTRRVVKGMALDWLSSASFTPEYVSSPENNLCPYGQPGDRLWVRESGLQRDAQLFKMFTHDATPGRYWVDSDGGRYGASYGPAITRESMVRQGWKVRPSIHMPRWASRITLEVTGVRVERLQDISQGDALAEGAPPSHPSIDSISREYGFADFPRSWFGQLWESINGAGSWDANPWVWVVEFRRIEQEAKAA